MTAAPSWKPQAATFRRQLILPQQQQLFGYWLERMPANDWPAWRDIRPADIRALLPNLLVLEPRPQPEAIRVRLAGSELWDIHGGEVTGTTLTHRLWGARADYWRRIYERLRGEAVPDCGQLRDDARMAVLFWMRLPVRADDGATWLLGLDLSVPLSRLDQPLRDDDPQAREHLREGDDGTGKEEEMPLLQRRAAPVMRVPAMRGGGRIPLAHSGGA